MQITELQKKLLLNRGIAESEWEQFLSPSWERDLHDPFLMKDMKVAVDRILQAIKTNEKIAIFADYDADGVPGAAMWQDFFEQIKFSNFLIYIPDRHNEGFGLNNEAVKHLVSQGVKLLITLDCGITDCAEVNLAQQLGLEVIITDHHLPPEQLPNAVAIVDPKRVDDEYPEKMLCGCAVAFKLLSAILQTENFGLKQGAEKWWMDLVAISTCSDMVPLLNENRVLAKYGLLVLQKTRRLGLQTLFALTRTDPRFLNETNITFTITPRINAASRMGQTKLAFDLLTAKNEIDAKDLANQLEKLNKERKVWVTKIVKEAKRELKARQEKIQYDGVIVLGNKHWRPALLGLVANSLLDEYQVPIFLWGQEGAELIKGSCRSTTEISAVEIMQLVKGNFFEDCGGHHASGGFSLLPEKIFELEEKIIAAVKELTNHDTKKESSKFFIDETLRLSEVNEQLFQEVEQLAPFGEANQRPTFIFKNLQADKIEQFGKEGGHLKINFTSEFGQKIEAIAWFATVESFTKTITVVDTFTLIAQLEKTWFGKVPQLRLHIIDIV